MVRSWGTAVPPSREFSTISDAIKFVAGKGDKSYYFKSNRYLESDATYGGDADEVAKYLETRIQKRYGNNISCIIQEKIKGVAVSTAQWFNGRSFVGPVEATIEHKKAWNDDLGPSTGCSFNLIYFYEEVEPSIVKALNWRKFEAVLRDAQASPGLYDINALLGEDDGAAYFLEFTPRLGYDSEITSQQAISDLGGFLFNLALGKPVDHFFDTSKLYGSIRLSIPPYPWENYDPKAPPKKSCVGTPVWGVDGLWDGSFVAYGLSMGDDGLEVADPSGMVGLSASTGQSVDKIFERCVEYAKEELTVPGLQFRTDAAACVNKDLKAMKKLGYEVPRGVR
jgi:hypothetical protein